MYIPTDISRYLDGPWELTEADTQPSSWVFLAVPEFIFYRLVRNELCTRGILPIQNNIVSSYNTHVGGWVSGRRSIPGKKIQGDDMGFTVYSIDVRPGNKFFGITTDFNARIAKDLADTALETPQTWHGVEMKNAGVSSEAFRVVQVSRDLKEAEETQAKFCLLAEQFVDATAHEWYKRMPRGYDPSLDGGVNEERLDVLIYKCSGCRFFSTTFSRVQAHFKSSKCTKQVVHEYHTHFIAPCVSTAPPLTRPANSLAHLEASMATRVPSGLSALDDLDTLGIDERTEYLLSSPEVLRACFDRKAAQRIHPISGVDISLKMFMHLWGSKAPRRFQTVFTHNHTMYDLRAVEDPSDPSTVDLTTIDDFNEFMVNLYAALDEIALATSSNALRIGEQLAAVASDYREALCGKWMTTLDVLDHTPQYERLRKKDTSRVKFANALKTAVRGVVKKTLLVKATPA